VIVATPEDESLTPPVRLETICQDAVSSSYVEYALRPWRKDVDMSRSHIIHAIHALLQDMVGIFFFFFSSKPYVVYSAANALGASQDQLSYGPCGLP